MKFNLLLGGVATWVSIGVLTLGVLSGQEEKKGFLKKVFKKKPPSDSSTKQQNKPLFSKKIPLGTNVNPPSPPNSYPPAQNGQGIMVEKFPWEKNQRQKADAVYEIRLQEFHTKIQCAMEEWGKAVDEAAQHVDRWGYASATGLILIEDTAQGRVGFDYQRGFTENLREAGRVQASSANFIQQSLEASLNVNADLPDEDSVESDEFYRRYARSSGVLSSTHIDRVLSIDSSNAELRTPAESTDPIHIARLAQAGRVLYQMSTTSLNNLPFKDAFQRGDEFIQGPREPGSLLPTQDVRLSLDDRQNIAASTTVSGKLLELMANPKGMPENTKAFLGITQLSVSPGFKTSKDYIAEVTVSVDYGMKIQPKLSTPMGYDVNLDELYNDAVFHGKTDLHPDTERWIDEFLDAGDHKYLTWLCEQAGVTGAKLTIEKIKLAQRGMVDRIRPPQPHEFETPPLIYSAFPLAKSQVLDQRHSFASQMDMMWTAQFQMLSAGRRGAARQMGRYIKQIQHDVATMNALPVVVPSSNGRFISYRFDPSLHALENPARADSRSGNLLKALSIPALVVIVCHENDLKRFKSIRLQSFTRWVPRNGKQILGHNNLLPTVKLPASLSRSQMEPKIHAVERLDKVKSEMMLTVKEAQTDLPTPFQSRLLGRYEGMYASLLSRINDLSQKAGTSYFDVSLPDRKRSMLRVTPDTLQTYQTRDLNQDVYFTVTGHDWDRTQVDVGDEVQGFIGGYKLDTVVPQSGCGLCDTYVFKLDRSKDSEKRMEINPGVYPFVLRVGNEVRVAQDAVKVRIEPEKPMSIQERLYIADIVDNPSPGRYSPWTISGGGVRIAPSTKSLRLGKDFGTSSFRMMKIQSNLPPAVSTSVAVQIKRDGKVINPSSDESIIVQSAETIEEVKSGGFLIGTMAKNFTFTGVAEKYLLFKRGSAPNFSTRYTIEVSGEQFKDVGSVVVE